MLFCTLSIASLLRLKTEMKLYTKKHFLFEFDSWRRSIDNIQIENNQIKHRLVQILEDLNDNKQLDSIEDFHNKLITEDRVINLFQSDLFKHEVALRKSHNGETVAEHKRLRIEIELLEINFIKMKNDFYLAFSDSK